MYRHTGSQLTPSQVLLDFCRSFPDGKEKSTKKRGQLGLVGYVHAQGTKRARVQEDEETIMDYEFFVVAMARHLSDA